MEPSFGYFKIIRIWKIKKVKKLRRLKISLNENQRFKIGTLYLTPCCYYATNKKNIIQICLGSIKRF